MKKRIICFMTMLSLLLSIGNAYAAVENISGVDYMDDIYRFDVEGAAEVEDYRLEILQQLGILENSEQNPFDAKKFLTRSELKNTALKAGGKMPLYAEDKQKVRLSEVYGELLQTLGYLQPGNEYDSSQILNLADSSGLADGLNLSINEYITEGDFMEILFNALTADIGSYPIYIRKGPLSDGTLLGNVFDTIKVNGVLNAIEGINLYDAADTRKGYVRIDREEYAIGKTNAEKYLGKRVTSYARYSEDADEYTLLNIEIEKASDNLVLEFDDIYDCTSQRLCYTDDDGKEKKVNISDVNMIVYNGKYVTGAKLSELIGESDGRVELTALKKNGGYEMAIIWTYSYFVIDTVDLQKEVVWLKYNAKWNGNGYISINDEARTRIFLNSAQIDKASLATNDVIKVLATEDGKYMEIGVARRVLTGNVTETDSEENTVRISGTLYKVSEAYNNAAKDSASGLKKLQNGMMGSFYISEDSKIVGFREGSQYSFGYLKKIVYDEETDSYSIKYLSQDGDWRTSKLSKRLTVDGEKMTMEEAGEFLIQNKEKITENLFRYKSDGVDVLNGNDSLTFIDTMLDTDNEKKDEERMNHCGSFENFMNYRCIYLIGSNYQLSTDTVIFRIPDNLEKEEDFAVIRNTQLPWGDESVKVPLELYNPSKYYLVGAAIYKGGEEAVGAEGFILIEKIMQYYDEEKEEVAYNVTGMYLNGGACEERQYTVSQSVAEKMQSFSVGDFNRYTVNGSTITGMKNFWCSGWNLPTPQSIYRYADYHYISGTVIERDPDNNLLVVDYGNSNIAVTRVPEKVAVMDKSGNKNVARVSDYSAIQIGDRVFFYDVYAYSNWCIVEKK